MRTHYDWLLNWHQQIIYPGGRDCRKKKHIHNWAGPVDVYIWGWGWILWRQIYLKSDSRPEKVSVSINALAHGGRACSQSSRRKTSSLTVMVLKNTSTMGLSVLGSAPQETTQPLLSAKNKNNREGVTSKPRGWTVTSKELRLRNSTNNVLDIDTQ